MSTPSTSGSRLGRVALDCAYATNSAINWPLNELVKASILFRLWRDSAFQVMAKARQSIITVLAEYLLIWTLGNLIGLTFWILILCRVIRIQGKDQLKIAMNRGHLLLDFNHPGLVETFILIGLGWPQMLVKRRYFIWCMPDRNLLPSWFKWVTSAGRGIEVDRGNKRPGHIQAGSPEEAQWRAELKRFNYKAFAKAARVLSGHNTLSVHAEGGRTFKYQDRGVSLLTCPSVNDRQMSEVQDGIFQLAKAADAWIMPIYIEMSAERRLLRGYRDGFLGLFKRGLGPIVFHCEHPPYKVGSPYYPAMEKSKLECLMLDCQPGQIVRKSD